MLKIIQKIKNLYKIRSRTRYARLEDTAQNRVLLYKIRLIGERIRYLFSALNIRNLGNSDKKFSGFA